MKNRPVNPAMEQVVVTIASTARCLGTSPATAIRAVRDHETALEALGRAERSLRAAQAAADPLPEATAGGSWRLVLAGLLGDVQGARADLLLHELARQRSLMTQVADGLARLRASRTIDDLVECVPIQACELGYERAMFSWVDREHWVPRSTFTMSGRDEARRILSAGSPPYFHVRDLMEVDVVRNRQTILVVDCETNPRMHPTIWPVSRSSTYVAAPVAARNHVAGLVHVDRSLESGLNDEFDRQLVGLFCEGIGVVLDRLLVSSTAVTHGLPRGVGSEHLRVADWVDALTPREHEVLRLLAIGLTNPQISNRLFISHDTTKTHVKRLMKKLGAHTRAEAGAMYHELRAETGPAELAGLGEGS